MRVHAAGPHTRVHAADPHMHAFVFGPFRLGG